MVNNFLRKCIHFNESSTSTESFAEGHYIKFVRYKLYCRTTIRNFIDIHEVALYIKYAVCRKVGSYLPIKHSHYHLCRRMQNTCTQFPVRLYAFAEFLIHLTPCATSSTTICFLYHHICKTQLALLVLH
jgi:hypothetical protein